MKCFIKFITDPDWWSVIATFVTAYVAARITSKFSKRQTELQEQQLRIQERQNELQEQQIKQNDYEIYSGIYDCLNQINAYVNLLLYKLSISISFANNAQSIQSDVVKLNEDLTILLQHLNKCSIDVALRWQEKIPMLNEYYEVVSLTRELLIFLMEIIEAGGVKTKKVKVNFNGEDKESQIKYIVEQCDNAISNEINDLLRGYLTRVQKINHIDILGIIRSRCKID